MVSSYVIFRILIVLLCLPITVGHAQQLRTQFELGINSAGFWKSDTYDVTLKTRLLPIVRPAFGVHLIGETRIGLFADVNARYFTTGTSYIRSRNDIDRIHNTPFEWREEERIVLHRLVYGVGLGYRFPFIKRRLSLVTGYRLTYNLSGNYSYSVSQRDGLGNNSQINKNYDPFTNPNLDQQARRNGWELYAAIKFDLSKRFGCMAMYSTPTYINFTENMMGHTSWDHHGYERSDISIALLYTVQQMP